MAKTLTEIRNEYMKAYNAYLLSNAGKPTDQWIPMPEKLKIQMQGFQIIDSVNDRSSMYEYLKARSMVKYGNYSDEKERVVRETVQELQSTAENASQPGLLLCKIQSGKTDTFVSIIGLSFDEYLDIAVVTTKGTNTLAKQTIKRLRSDFEGLIAVDRVAIFDILEDLKNKKIDHYDLNHKKIIIVCKKEDDNLKALVKLFKTTPELKGKKVLLVDDEADFGSRNYVVRKGEVDLQKNSKLIEEFSKLPDYFRYLQVTATPYSLFLQPDGTVMTKDGNVSSFKPRFTKIVPVHKGYVGGNEYFVLSKEENSMYKNLYTEIPDELVEKRLTDKNTFFSKPRNGKKSFESPSLFGLVNSIVTYFMSVAIRQYQEEVMYPNPEKHEIYKSCALYHLDTIQDKHEWQLELISKIVEELKSELSNKDYYEVHRLIRSIEENAFHGFESANSNGIDGGLLDVELPDFNTVHNRIAYILCSQNYAIQMVNSSKEGRPEINEEDGQLVLKRAANIFIGGNILDRGITIENMLCFFYGRDPKKMQMDTVLQHARMYGSRSMRDMAVTKFYTPQRIYDILVNMHEVDEALRQWLIEGKDLEDPAKVFVGIGHGFKPCATQKVRVANTMTLKHHKRIVHSGFQTLPKKYMTSKMEVLDKMIHEVPGFAGNKSDFMIDKDWAFKIIRGIRETYCYSREFRNEGRDWDITDMLGAIQYSTEKTGGKLICWYSDDRNIARIKLDNDFSDIPYDGKVELPMIKEMAVDFPVLMLLRENGLKENGWRDTPFYWPVLVLPKNMDDVIFTLNNEVKYTVRNSKDYESMMKGIKQEDYFKVTIMTEYFDQILCGDKTSEARDLKDSNYTTFLELKDTKKKTPALIDDTIELNAGIHSFNEGIFPFVLKKYKYILLVSGQTGNNEYALVKLSDPSEWQVIPEISTIDDDYMDRNGDTVTSYDKDFCTWTIIYRLDRIVRKRLLYKRKKSDEE